MRALLLPIKDLRNAKKRLTNVLTSEERFSLAEAMLADTIHAVRGVRCAEKIFVVTNYEPAMQLQTQQPGDASLLAKLRSCTHGLAPRSITPPRPTLPTIFLGHPDRASTLRVC